MKALLLIIIMIFIPIMYFIHCFVSELEDSRNLLPKVKINCEDANVNIKEVFIRRYQFDDSASGYRVRFEIASKNEIPLASVTNIVRNNCGYVLNEIHKKCILTISINEEFEVQFLDGLYTESWDKNKQITSVGSVNDMHIVNFYNEYNKIVIETNSLHGKWGAPVSDWETAGSYIDGLPLHKVSFDLFIRRVR